jgi:undecaprenyl diphosphate synthase
MNFLNSIDRNNVPKHIAIIMDGNGRWAKEQGQDRLFGHSHGVESVREALKSSTEIGVEYLTLYAFSTENWNRPKEEVDGLMELLVQTISNEVASLNENGVRLISIGDKTQLPESCQIELKNAIEKTSKNDKITLNLALNYSAKWEILEAVKAIASEVKDNNVQIDQINESLFESKLTTNKIPDPELLIRTSGEKRVSNFLLWQIAYSEFYFLDIFWPQFRKQHLFEAVYNYQNRERRFGMVSEQLK